MIKILPAFPLYHGGKTNFYPIHVTDMCEIIENVILNDINSETIECIGPEKLSFKEIIEALARSMEVKRLLIPSPLFMGKLFASIFEIFMKNPLLTRDQLILLKSDNSPSGNFKTNVDLNLNSKLKNFQNEISKYSYMWKTGGEFSK